MLARITKCCDVKFPDCTELNPHTHMNDERFTDLIYQYLYDFIYKAWHYKVEYLFHQYAMTSNINISCVDSLILQSIVDGFLQKNVLSLSGPHHFTKPNPKPVQTLNLPKTLITTSLQSPKPIGGLGIQGNRLRIHATNST